MEELLFFNPLLLLLSLAVVFLLHVVEEEMRTGLAPHRRLPIRVVSTRLVQHSLVTRPINLWGEWTNE